MAEFRAFLAWVTGKESMGEAGRELPGLARRLVRVTTADEAGADADADGAASDADPAAPGADDAGEATEA